MTKLIHFAKKCHDVPLGAVVSLLFSAALCIGIPCFSQKTANPELEKIPADLETDFALSALPPHLRAGATVYLLDPAKGFYVSHQGTNGFVCFISRTEWEWGEFRQDLAAAVSYDAEGARTIFPVDRDVAEMRASGKFTALQIRDSVVERIHNGIYKAPARTGISYMLAPVMRTYTGMPGNGNVMTMSVPHYMFYAPYLTDSDIGTKNNAPFSPILGNAGSAILGEKKGPYGYIILPAGEPDKRKITEDNAELMKRLADYKPYFKVVPGGMHHSS